MAVDVTATYTVSGTAPADTVDVTADYVVLAVATSVDVVATYTVVSPAAPAQLMRRTGSTLTSVRLGRRTGSSIAWLSPEV